MGKKRVPKKVAKKNKFTLLEAFATWLAKDAGKEGCLYHLTASSKIIIIERLQ